jgi:hypothetical protein
MGRRPQQFDEQTRRARRLTPEASGVEASLAAGRGDSRLEPSDADWLAELLPGEAPPRRDLFDGQTLRRVRFTPEHTRCKSELMRMPVVDSSPWYWKSVSTIDLAKSATTGGVVAACLVAIFNLVIAGLLAADPDLARGSMLDGLDFLPIALTAGVYFAIAWGIRSLSRIAAVLGLLLYVLDRLAAVAIVGPHLLGCILSFAVVLLFLNAVRGTFAYHSLARVESDSGVSNR